MFIYASLTMLGNLCVYVSLCFVHCSLSVNAVMFGTCLLLHRRYYERETVSNDPTFTERATFVTDCAISIASSSTTLDSVRIASGPLSTFGNVGWHPYCVIGKVAQRPHSIHTASESSAMLRSVHTASESSARLRSVHTASDGPSYRQGCAASAPHPGRRQRYLASAG